MDWLEGLNEEQKKVVLSTGKPILVVAGAGSGKTKTIVHKALFLIENKDILIRANRILLITFTNKAANEIKERIKKYGFEIEWIGTFHSVASRIIRKHHNFFNLSSDFRILDEDDTKKLFQNLLRYKNIDKEEGKRLFLKVNQAIEDLLFLDEDNKFDKKVLEYKESFISLMLEQNAVSFSYLMGALKNKLQTNDKFREYYKNFFDYIIIDEFQDTNTTQYDIVKSISKKHNICVIGDPNQCIYEWRMAHPDNILNFINDFNPEIIKLGINYRSSPSILNLANEVLKHSKAHWKDLVPILKSQKNIEDIKPVLILHQDEDEEAKWIAKKILELNIPYEKVAVLVRANYITDFIEKAFSLYRIPYVVVGALKFFQRKEIKDILAYIYFALNPQDTLSFERAISNPKIGIGTKTIERIINLSRQKSIDLLKATEFIIGNRLFEETNFVSAVKRLRHNLQASPSDISFHIEKLIRDVNYFEYLEREYPEDFKERQENLKELIRFFENQTKDKHSFDLMEFLQDISFLEEQDDDSKQNSVKIMTIHKAKGLEFDVVFMPRLEDGILPHNKSFNDIFAMEEERRLFYVGITRAMRYLFISYTKNGHLSQFVEKLNKSLIDTSLMPRDFIKDITTKAITSYDGISYNNKSKSSFLQHHLKEGDMVSHEVFGDGKIMSIDKSKGIVRVLFKDKERAIMQEFLKPV